MCCAQVLEGGLSRAGVPYSYGFAIILLTIMVKVATFPLSKKSVSWRARVACVGRRVGDARVAGGDNLSRTMRVMGRACALMFVACATAQQAQVALET
jgi:hypothetical protein